MKVEKVKNNLRKKHRMVIKKKLIERWIYIIMLKEEMLSIGMTQH